MQEKTIEDYPILGAVRLKETSEGWYWKRNGDDTIHGPFTSGELALRDAFASHRTWIGYGGDR